MTSQVKKLLVQYERYSYFLEKYNTYLVLKGYCKNTTSAYKQEAKKFFIFMDKDLIDRDMIMKFVMQQPTKEASTKNRIISCTNNIIEFAESINKFDDTNNGFKLCSVRQHRKLPKILSYEDISVVLDTLKNNRKDWMSYRDYALFIFLYATGVRVSECIELTTADLIEDKLIKVNNGKGSKDRIVPIAMKAVEALKEYIELCPFDTSKNLWVNYRGKKISRISIFKITKQCANISPHKLRHSYATHMYNNGMDLMVLSQLLGHENIETTEIYLHVDNKQLKECIAKHHPINNLTQEQIQSILC